ncbi:hypothetical protein CWC21_01415 [Pseudoalteromonas phenolica]|nr:hypothetical protein CWC21_01415 [Pseudoalteromonas phenolica]
MYYETEQKKLKNLTSEKELANAATPNVAGGYLDSDNPDCLPTNRADCRTGAISCWNGRDCVFTNRFNMCD